MEVMEDCLNKEISLEDQNMLQIKLRENVKRKASSFNVNKIKVWNIEQKENRFNQEKKLPTFKIVQFV